MTDFLRDLRFAVRQLRKRPGFTAAAVLTLALGIGANTAIVSLADGALLREPPVRDPERLAVVYTTCRRGDPRCASSYPDFEDYRNRSSTFRDMTAYSWVPLSVGGEGESRLATGQLVSGSYFRVLGVAMHAGRGIEPEDNLRGAPAQVAVLGYDLWQSQFAGDRSLIGRSIRINGTPYTVVGVASRGFRGVDLGGEPEIWLPMLSGPALGEGAGAAADPGIFDVRGNRWIHAVVGRLADGATLAQARSEMLAISAALAQEDPDARGPRSVTVDRMAGYVLPVGNRDDLVRFVTLLVAVVGFTLLLAAANLANLLLSRATARQKEMGIRLAIGASRGRVIRQLLTESVTLALLGGMVGLVVALWMLELLSGFELPGGVIVGWLDIGLDGRTLMIALLLSLLTSLLFGVIPAWQSARRDLVTALMGTVGAPTSDKDIVRKSLIAVQVGLCLVLLAGSGLFLKTLWRALAFDPGFRTGNVAVARYNPALLRYTPEQGEQLVGQLLMRLRRLPAVEAASVGTLIPLQQGGFRGTFVTVEGYEPAADEELRVNYVFVGTDYFRSLGIPLRRGRAFTSRDDAGGPPVAVINQTMAERYWAGRDPIGGRLEVGNTPFEVVGVVGDAKWRSLGESSSPYVFFPIQQYPSEMSQGFVTLIARTDDDAAAFLPALRSELRRLDPTLVLSSHHTMEDALRRVLMPQRMGAVLFTMLAILALVLAAVGIYGLVSYTVVRETRNIGIRIALGAERRDVLRWLLSDVAAPVGIGIGVGLVTALGLAGAAGAFMFRVSAQDPVTFLVIAAFLTIIATVAAVVPASRAARIDPMQALRYE